VGLKRAAEMGYAPAQAALSRISRGAQQEERFVWAQRAAAQSYRKGIDELAECFLYGYGCTRDTRKATELYRESAELESPLGQFRFGKFAFGPKDWERYLWWGRAATRGHEKWTFLKAVDELLPAFEKGELGRVLHAVAQVIRATAIVARNEVVGFCVGRDSFEKYVHLLGMHDEMMNGAREAIACWSIVGRRCGVVKDIRLVIAKVAWA
jgi:hypothetical protein